VHGQCHARAWRGRASTKIPELSLPLPPLWLCLWLCLCLCLCLCLWLWLCLRLCSRYVRLFDCDDRCTP
jgi:hypothetical protein